MRRLSLWAGGLAGLLVLSGCVPPWMRNSSNDGTGRMVGGNPSAETVVAGLNDNANLVQSLQCTNVTLEGSRGLGILQRMEMPAKLVCQRPRNFRLQASLSGTQLADVGSNNDEFWFWMGKTDEPYVFHCSYQDFASGRVQLDNFPFQPEWVMEVLGMGTYDPRKQYQVVPERNGVLDLVEQTRGADNKPVRKVTMVQVVGNGRYQVIGHKLMSANGRDPICSALVRKLVRDQATGAILPSVVELSWPAQRMTMKLTMNDLRVNPPIPPEQAAVAFTRNNLRSLQGYDLARRAPDAPQGQALQQAGGAYQTYPYPTQR
jgi:hypothetical protein